MVKYLTKDDDYFDLVDNGLILVDFYADWCGPCKMLGSILEEIDYVDILKVNTDEFPEFETSAERFNFFGGLAGGICYMPADWETLKGKPVEVTLKRANGTKLGGHHSVLRTYALYLLYIRALPAVDFSPGDTVFLSVRPTSKRASSV